MLANPQVYLRANCLLLTIAPHRQSRNVGDPTCPYYLQKRSQDLSIYQNLINFLFRNCLNQLFGASQTIIVN